MTNQIDIPLDPELNGISIGLRAPASPHELYADIQARCPVIKVADKNYTVTKLADVVAINRHPDVRGMGGAFEGVGTAGSKRPLIPLDIDGPDHAKWRRLLDPLFSPKRVAQFRDEIAARTNRMIDEFIARGKAEIYSEWCLPLPCTMFLTVVGLPTEDLEQFVRFKDDVLSFADGSAEGQAIAETAGEKAYNYFNAALDAREELLRSGVEPSGTIIDELLTGRVEGRPINREEMVDILYLLVMAGLDTLTSSLSCILAWLAVHPEERSALVADSSGWPAAIEELMRHQSPVMYGFRRADKDLDINGTVFPAGSLLTVMWGMANVDPEAFEDPTKVRFDRPRNPHIAFASGTHRCLGSHLARLELHIALEEFHRRIPDYRVDPNDEVVWDGMATRKPVKLPIVWDV